MVRSGRINDCNIYDFFLSLLLFSSGFSLFWQEPLQVSAGSKDDG